jgi:predicted phage terminase large subunit-like protein
VYIPEIIIANEIATEREWITEYLSRLKAEESFYEFVKQAWEYVEGPKRPYSDNWHMKALCDHLQAIYEGDLKCLLINLPPRCSKSLVMCVFFPAWVFLKAPHLRIYCSSHSRSLSLRDSIRCRALIGSDWYQARWGDRFFIKKNIDSQIKFETNAGGFRECTSVKSKTTGNEGDILLLDDPNNAIDAESDVKRNSINESYAAGWSNRLTSYDTGRSVVAQQRTHQMDVSGYILENDPLFVHLMLPMEFEAERKCRTVTLSGKVWEDPRNIPGELLWPNRIGDSALKRLKNGLGSEYRIAGQLQQRPAPAEGGLIKKAWWKLWKHPSAPKYTQIIQSWDTALNANELDAYSACTTWGLFNDENGIPNLILINMWRGRVEYPELRKLAKLFYQDYRNGGPVEIKGNGDHVPDIVMVEEKASGFSLIQDFRRAGISAMKFNPTPYGDKIARVKLSSFVIETGRVWLPAKGPDFITLKDYAHNFRELCSVFPNSEARDVVDSMTQVLIRLIYSGQLRGSEDDNSKTGSIIPKNTGYPIERGAVVNMF